MNKISCKHMYITFSALVLIGIVSFIYKITGNHPERGWQTYLINFLFWSGIAQGGLLFSAVTTITKAKWSKPLQGLSEAFTVFFPISLLLYLLLLAGRSYIFPWMGQDLNGKESWLNLPFLFSRDLVGIIVLYGLGLFYLFYSLRLRLKGREGIKGGIRSFLYNSWKGREPDFLKEKSRLNILSVLYSIAYALVLSLIGFDLIMSMDFHWISTLFGAYSFVKAFYIGLGGLIILSALVQIRYGGLSSNHFHDLGKLFFGFCLVWADFFYCQFLVIWYGNLPEETSYIIKRTMTEPWNRLAWTIFTISFIIPFFILLNRKVKTKPVTMLPICIMVIIGIWLEHLLLIGPALNHAVKSIPIGISDGLVSIGFMGLMALSVTFFLNLFPELLPGDKQAG